MKQAGVCTSTFIVSPDPLPPIPSNSSTMNRGHLPLCKGKAMPLQTSTGPEGSRRFRLPDFKTVGT